MIRSQSKDREGFSVEQDRHQWELLRYYGLRGSDVHDSYTVAISTGDVGSSGIEHTRLLFL
jgi:hypothetical protein